MQYHALITRVPLALTALRALLGPVLLSFACLIMALLSDYFDGVSARKLEIATSNLRRLDSVADTIFYLCATVAVGRLYPAVLWENRFSLAVLVLLEVGRYAFDLRKFGREASYHMWSSKIWGVLLFAAFVAVLGYGQDGVPVTLAIYWGIACDLEGLAISMKLDAWQADVPSLWHAFNPAHRKSA